MKKYFLPLIAAFITSAFHIPPVAAAERSSDMIEAIQEESSALLDDYTQLQDEQKFLQMELAELDSEGHAVSAPAKPVSSDSGSLKFIQIDHLKETIAAIEKHNRSLEKEWMVLDEKEKLRQLQLDDLGYQERSLKLENQLQETIAPSGKNPIPSEDEELTNLRRQLSESEMREQQMIESQEQLSVEEEKLADASSVNDDLPRLRSELGQLKKEKDDQVKKIKSLKKENTKAPSTNKQKSQRKAALTAQILTLEAEINRIDQQVDYVSGLHGRKRKLIDEIMALDRKNQDLRSKMSDLTQNIEVLRTEIGLLESRLPVSAEQSGIKE